MREWFCCNVHRRQLQVTSLFWYTTSDCFDSIYIFNSSNYIASNDRSLNNELERIWKWPWPDIRYYPGICLKKWRKAMKELQTGQLVYEPKFEPQISQIWSRSLTIWCEVWSYCVFQIAACKTFLWHSILSNYVVQDYFIQILWRSVSEYLLLQTLVHGVGSFFRIWQLIWSKIAPPFMEPEIPLWQRWDLRISGAVKTENVWAEVLTVLLLSSGKWFHVEWRKVTSILEEQPSIRFCFFWVITPYFH